jgi:hypothetical protein
MLSRHDRELAVAKFRDGRFQELYNVKHCTHVTLVERCVLRFGTLLTDMRSAAVELPKINSFLWSNTFVNNLIESPVLEQPIHRPLLDL